jgi:hypothetical protein
MSIWLPRSRLQGMQMRSTVKPQVLSFPAILIFLHGDHQQEILDISSWTNFSISDSSHHDESSSKNNVDKGMTTKAHNLSNPRIRSGRSPWNLGASIVIIEIWDHIVTRIVICIKPGQFLETWPPINRGQERPARGTHRDWAEIDSKFTLSTQCLPCLSETLPLSSSDVLFPRS